MALQTVSVSSAAYKLSLSVPKEYRRCVIDGMAPALASHFYAVLARPAHIKKLDVTSAEKIITLIDQPSVLDSIESCDKRVSVVCAIARQRQSLGLVAQNETIYHRLRNVGDADATRKTLYKSSPLYSRLAILNKMRFADHSVVSEWIGSLDESSLQEILVWFASSNVRHSDMVAAAVTDLCIRSTPETLAKVISSGPAPTELCLEAVKRLSRDSQEQLFWIITKTRRAHNTFPLEGIKARVRSGEIGFSLGFTEKMNASQDMGLRLVADQINPRDALEVVEWIESTHAGDLRFDVLRLLNNAELVDAVLKLACERDWFTRTSAVFPNTLANTHGTTPVRIGNLLQVPGISRDSVSTLLDVADQAAIVRFLLLEEFHSEDWMFDKISKRVSSSSVMWATSEIDRELVSESYLCSLASSMVQNSEDLTQVLYNGWGYRDNAMLLYESVAKVLAEHLGHNPHRWGVFGGFLESLEGCTLGTILEATDALSG